MRDNATSPLIRTNTATKQTIPSTGNKPETHNAVELFLFIKFVR